MRYLWAFLFWISAILTIAAAYLTWDISEGTAPHRNSAVLIAAFITAAVATATALSLRQLFQASSKPLKK